MMKCLLLLLVAVSSAASLLAVDYTPKGWLTDVDTAKKLSAEKKLPILVLISGPEWCPPCRALERTVINERSFQSFVKANAVGLFINLPRGNTTRELKQTLQKFSFFQNQVPAYALVDSNLKVLTVPKKRSVFEFKKAITEASQMLNKK